MRRSRESASFARNHLRVIALDSRAVPSPPLKPVYLADEGKEAVVGQVVEPRRPRSIEGCEISSCRQPEPTSRAIRIGSDTLIEVGTRLHNPNGMSRRQNKRAL